MISLALHFDMRAPEFGAEPADLYEAAIAQTAWADEVGFDHVYLPEHHTSDDGYLPSPIVLGSSMASRTSRIRLGFHTLVAPFYQPLRLAEDLAVLDIISRGRVDVMLSLGFRSREFAMLGVNRARRVPMLEEAVRVLREAWSGEEFEYEGRRVRVTPRPYQRPGPAILLGGTAEPSALRAAAIADGYEPSSSDLYAVYQAELARLGKAPAPPYRRTTAVFLHVTRDVEGDWKRIGPHLLHTTNSYADWWAEERAAGTAKDVRPESVPFVGTPTIEALREGGLYLVLTPQECVTYVNALPPSSEVLFRPLCGGLPPELAWKSLRLFEQEVMPALERQGLRSPRQ